MTPTISPATFGTALQRIRAHRYAIGGYACVFNTISVHHGGPELVKPGTYARALAAGDWYLLGNHIVGAPSLASMNAGTLHVEEDHYGLWFVAQLPDDDGVGARVMEAIRRCQICGVSTGAEGAHRVRHVNGTRILSEAPVWEISLVSLPNRPARVGTWVRPYAEAKSDRLRCWRLAP